MSTQQSQNMASDLEWEHGDGVRAVNAVPDAEVSSVLGDHHITAWHPLDIGAEAQQRSPHSALYVIQMELGGRKESEIFKLFRPLVSSSVMVSYIKITKGLEKKQKQRGCE